MSIGETESLFPPPGEWSLSDSICSRFEEQASCHSTQIAISAGNDRITYAALNKRANQIADSILTHDLVTQQIALLMNPGPDMIAGMIGILKAGKTFVPLDPHYPHSRTRIILSDSQSSLLLVDSANHRLATELSADVLHILDIGQIICEKDPAPRDIVRGDTNAYLLYTSGTTGIPKGVIQSHRIVLHNVWKYSTLLNITHQDRWTLLFSPCFGEAMNDIFSALLNGCTLCMYDIRGQGTRGLEDWLDYEQITIYHSVPTVYRHTLCTDTPRRSLSALRALCLGGESVNRHDVEYFKKRFSPPCLLVNAYGSTETKLIRMYLVNASTKISGNRMPAGFTVPDTDVAILDENGKMLGPNQIGEIVVQSKYLARYWQESDGNSRFVKLPGSTRRQYHTGDQGYLDENDCLYHLGRLDDQVKIRGHRVEIADVETALLDISWISEAVVTTQNTENGLQLIAYLVPRPKNASKPDRVIREELKKRLAQYMIPARFFLFDSLPVTSNGKINRAALPKPDRENLRLELPYLAPVTEIEMRLTAICAVELGLSVVGREDDLMELGCDSISTLSILTQISGEFGCDLDPSVFLKKTTIRTLSALIDDRGNEWEDDVRCLVPIRQIGSKNPFFCIHPAGGQVLAFQKLASKMSPDRPFYALQGKGLNGIQPPHADIREMASCYLKEMVLVQPHGPYLIGGRCVGSYIAYEIGLQLLERGESVGLLVILDKRTPPKPPSSPSTRFLRSVPRLLRYGKVRNRFATITTEYDMGPVVRAHHWADRHYEAPSYSGSVALILGELPQNSQESAKKSWSERLVHEPEMFVIKGASHRTLLNEPYVDEVAVSIDAVLDQVD